MTVRGLIGGGGLGTLVILLFFIAFIIFVRFLELLVYFILFCRLGGRRFLFSFCIVCICYSYLFVYR